MEARTSIGRRILAARPNIKLRRWNVRQVVDGVLVDREVEVPANLDHDTLLRFCRKSDMEANEELASQGSRVKGVTLDVELLDGEGCNHGY